MQWSSIKFFRSTKIFFSLTFFYSVNFILDWPFLRFFGLSGVESFGDLRITLRGATCKSGTGLSSSCPDFLYGRTLKLALSKFPLNDLSLYLLAILFTLIFIGVWSVLVLDLSNSPKKKFALLALAVSPPFQFLIERNNIDIVIFSIIYVCFKMYRRRSFFLVFILLSISILSKYYVLPLLFLLVINLPREIRRKYFVMLILLSGLVISDLMNLSKTIALSQTSGWASFGFQTLPTNLNNKFGMIPIVISLLEFLFVLFVLGICFLQNRKPTSIVYKHNSFPYWSALIYVSCYFAGISYDYRLVFLAAASTILLNDSSRACRLHCILLFIVFFGGFAPGIVQIIGDVIQLYFVGILLAHLIWAYNRLELKVREL